MNHHLTLEPAQLLELKVINTQDISESLQSTSSFREYPSDKIEKSILLFLKDTNHRLKTGQFGEEEFPNIYLATMLTYHFVVPTLGMDDVINQYYEEVKKQYKLFLKKQDLSIKDIKQPLKVLFVDRKINEEELEEKLQNTDELLSIDNVAKIVSKERGRIMGSVNGFRKKVYKKGDAKIIKLSKEYNSNFKKLVSL